MEKTEYRVREVTRWVVTKYSGEVHNSGGLCLGKTETLGEFDNKGFADEVARKMRLADYVSGCMMDEGEKTPKPPKTLDEQMKESVLMQGAGKPGIFASLKQT